MNQDFIIECTPGNARRLLFISDLCKIDIDPLIAERAKQDRLQASDFTPDYPDTPVCRAALQFMLDCNLRCAISATYASEVGYTVVLRALTIRNIRKVTVVTHKPTERWTKLLSSVVGLSDVVVGAPETIFDPVVQADRHDGVLIFDTAAAFDPGVATSDCRTVALCTAFPQTVIFRPAVAEQQGWHSLASFLWPDFAHPVVDHSASTLKGTYMPKTSWHVRGREDLAMIYNVFLAEKMIHYR